MSALASVPSKPKAEQLRHLALDGKPPGQLDHACRQGPDLCTRLRALQVAARCAQGRRLASSARRACGTGWPAGSRIPPAQHGARHRRGECHRAEQDEQQRRRRAGSASTAGTLAARRPDGGYLWPPMAPAAVDTVVMKFGGTSVADAERIQRAAAHRDQRRGGQQRRGGAVRARKAHRRARIAGARGVQRPHPREMDMLLSTGERVSCAPRRWSSTTSGTRRSR